MKCLTSGEALMHILQPTAQNKENVLVLATGDGNLEGQAPNTAPSLVIGVSMAVEAGKRPKFCHTVR